MPNFQTQRLSLLFVIVLLQLLILEFNRNNRKLKISSAATKATLREPVYLTAARQIQRVRQAIQYNIIIFTLIWKSVAFGRKP